MHGAPMIIRRLPIRKIPHADTAVSVARRLLVPFEGRFKVEALVALRTPVVMKGAAVILEAQGGLEGAVAVAAVAVTGGALVIFEGEGAVTVVARVHGDCVSNLRGLVLYRVSCV